MLQLWGRAWTLDIDYIVGRDELIFRQDATPALTRATTRKQEDGVGEKCIEPAARMGGSPRPRNFVQIDTAVAKAMNQEPERQRPGP